jgi:hypothetical protein
MKIKKLFSFPAYYPWKDAPRSRPRTFLLVCLIFGALLFAISLPAGSVLAAEVSEEDYKLLQKIKQEQADKEKPAHEQPHPHEPPTGGHANLAGAATNPVANLVQFQMQNSYSPSSYDSDGYSNVAIIQPVIPIKLPWEKVPLIVTRTTLPYITTPRLDNEIGDDIGRHKGFGDIVAQGYFLPKLKTKGVTVGLGYNLTIPTAGDNDFVGSGKWSLGPGAIYLNQQTKGWQWGLLSYSSFSFADSNSDRSYVSNISVQPILNYHFGKGWYVSPPDVPQTYDFRTDNWTLAIGPRLGKVMKFGKQPVNLFGQVYYNPKDYDDQVAAKWTFKVNLTLLFPK